MDSDTETRTEKIRRQNREAAARFREKHKERLKEERDKKGHVSPTPARRKASTTYYQRNRDYLLTKQKAYYQEHKPVSKPKPIIITIPPPRIIIRHNVIVKFS
jgi:hypothetical protein